MEDNDGLAWHEVRALLLRLMRLPEDGPGRVRLTLLCTTEAAAQPGGTSLQILYKDKPLLTLHAVVGSLIESVIVALTNQAGLLPTRREQLEKAKGDETGMVAFHISMNPGDYAYNLFQIDSITSAPLQR